MRCSTLLALGACHVVAAQMTSAYRPQTSAYAVAAYEDESPDNGDESPAYVADDTSSSSTTDSSTTTTTESSTTTTTDSSTTSTTATTTTQSSTSDTSSAPTVTATVVGDYEYYGCVTLSEESACFTKVTSDDSMSLDLCAASCPSAVFGVYNGDCYCGQSTDSLSKVADSMCDTACPGNGGQRCGGHSTPQTVVLSAYVRASSGTSTVTRTHVTTVTACPEYVNNCPVGSKTTAVVVETLYPPHATEWHRKKIVCYGDNCAPEHPCADCDRFRVVCEGDHCRVEPAQTEQWHKLVICKGNQCHYPKCEGGECNRKIVCFDGHCSHENCYGDECKKNFVCRGDECKHEQCQGDECHRKLVCQGEQCQPQPHCQGKECPTPAPPRCQGKECPPPAPARCQGKECQPPAAPQPAVPAPVRIPVVPVPASPARDCRSKPFEKVVCRGESCFRVGCQDDTCHRIVCQGGECKRQPHEKCNGQGPECNEKYLCLGGECKAQQQEMCEGEGEECHERAVCRGDECYKAICQGDKCTKTVCYGDDCRARTHEKCPGGDECTEKVICRGQECGYPARKKFAAGVEVATPVAPASSYATGVMPYNSGDNSQIQVGGTDRTAAVALNLLGAAAGLAFML